MESSNHQHQIYSLRLAFFLQTLCLIKNSFFGSSHVAQRLRTQVVSLRMQVRSLALLRNQRGQELCCRSQTWLGFHIAVAIPQASGCSSDWTPSLGTSLCHGCGPKKTKKTKQTKQTKTFFFLASTVCPILRIITLIQVMLILC